LQVLIGPWNAYEYRAFRMLGDWQRLGSDQAVKPRVAQFGTQLQSEAITGASMADWAQIQGSNKLYISFYRNRSGMGYGFSMACEK